MRIPKLLCAFGLVFALNSGVALNANTEFRVLSWSGKLKDIYFQGSGGQMLEIDAGKRSFSEPYVYTGEAHLQFFRRSISKETGEEVFKPVAELSTIPNYQTVGLLLFEKGSENYQLYAMDIGAKKLPGGAFCFTNMTQRELAFQVAGKSFYLNSGQNRDFRPGQEDDLEDAPEDADVGGRSIIVRAAENQSGSWTPVLNVRWMQSKTARTFVFVYNRDDGEIAMRRFSDRG